MSQILPDCMMPDGGECCQGYQQLERDLTAANEALADRLWERDIARASLSVAQTEIERLNTVLSAADQAVTAERKRAEQAEQKLSEREREVAELRRTLSFASNHLKHYAPNTAFPSIDAALRAKGESK